MLIDFQLSHTPLFHNPINTVLVLLQEILALFYFIFFDPVRLLKPFTQTQKIEHQHRENEAYQSPQ